MSRDISARLKQVREEKQFTPELLSEKTGINLETILDWEAGKNLPDAAGLVKLSKVYGMSIDEIVYNGTAVPEYNEDKAVYKPRTVAYDGDKSLRGNPVNNASHKKKASESPAVKFITYALFPLLCLGIYLVMGLGFAFWHPGWMVFLLVPIYYACILIVRRLSKDVDDAVAEYMEEEEKKQ